jgi:FdhD protein
MRGVQRTFDRTGGLHAAALFDDSGSLLVMHEDVGRHNAVDKVVGSRLLVRALPARRTVLMVSGRTSFEIVQKAATAGIPVVCAVSAPSSYAVSLAGDMNITLTGFMRGETMNVYTHPERIVP